MSPQERARLVALYGRWRERAEEEDNLQLMRPNCGYPGGDHLDGCADDLEELLGLLGGDS